MSRGPLVVRRDGPVIEVTLDRPKANAIDAATSRAMGELFAAFRDDPDLRVAILTGAGDRFFSAGWDLKAAAGGEAYDADFGVGGFGGFPELPDLDKPVIAAVNGLAVGGGFELVLAADLAIAAEGAAFALPEPSVGLAADAGTLRLPRLVPPMVAREVLLAGRRLAAGEALALGLLNAVVRPDGLMARARATAAAVARQAPLAVAATKQALRRTEGLPLADAFRLLRGGELAGWRRMLASEDAREGARAFAEKRPPRWRGR